MILIFDGLNGTLSNADWNVFDVTLFDINVILISKMNIITLSGIKTAKAL